MVSTYTPNKNLELPGYNDYVDSWNTPVNADFTAVDTALGGVTTFNVTAVSGDVTLTSTQYRPFQIVISGTLSANVRYLIPAGVGGQWTVTNSTSGAFTLSIASAAGGSNITLPIGTTIVSCDGTATGMRLSISNTANVVSTFSAGTTGLTPSSATGGAVTLAGTLAVANGGTGLTAAPDNGQIDIGNGTGFTRTTLTAGAGITITNGAGSIIIGSAAGGGTVTSVDVSGGTTGLTTSGGPVTTSGTITLAGTLAVANGGTGITTVPTNGQIPIGNGSTYTAAALTAGSGISITNGAGSVTLAASSQSGRLINTQVFTSSGTYTRTSGVTTAVVIAVGGGGGGTGANGPNPGSSGGNGGTTSFGSHVSAIGGSGGSGAYGGAGGTGGSSATIAMKGQGGGAGASGPTGGLGGGQGGGAGVGLGAGNTGIRGGGGSGGANTTGGCCGGSYAGGGGGQGETAIKYATTVGATETVTIGAGGTAGVGAANGGAGGAGYVIVYEYS